MPNLNTLLDHCVLLVYEFFDRFFLNGYVARLQDADDLRWFLTRVRGHQIPRYEVLGESPAASWPPSRNSPPTRASL